MSRWGPIDLDQWIYYNLMYKMRIYYYINSIYVNIYQYVWKYQLFVVILQVIRHTDRYLVNKVDCGVASDSRSIFLYLLDPFLFPFLVFPSSLFYLC